VLGQIEQLAQWRNINFYRPFAAANRSQLLKQMITSPNGGRICVTPW
jgi:hypothetical protein